MSEPQPENLDAAVTEVGRELMKYLFRRADEMGINLASYRQARMDVQRALDGQADPKFNWGFEALFTREIRALEDLGLIVVKYGSGAIMAGKGKPNQIYNISLSDEGRSATRAILQREAAERAQTEKIRRRVSDEVEDDTEAEARPTDVLPDISDATQVRDDTTG